LRYTVENHTTIENKEWSKTGVELSNLWKMCRNLLTLILQTYVISEIYQTWEEKVNLAGIYFYIQCLVFEYPYCKRLNHHVDNYKRV
jgi:hypothetical protein